MENDRRGLYGADGGDDLRVPDYIGKANQISIQSLERILDGIDAHIYVTVPKTGELLFVNKQLRTSAGRENDSFVGEYCYRVFRGLDEMCDFCPCKKLDENSDQTVVWEEYVEIYGRHVVHSDSYIDWPGGEKAHLQHIVDITDLRNMTNDLKEAKEAAERSSRYKTDFLAKMSHEIRTPMNAIIGMTELALRESDDAARTEHIFTIKQAGANLLAIINDILDFSKIEAGKVETVNNDYSVASLLSDVVNIIRMRVVDSQIRFAVKVDSNTPKALYGDETRIRQALLNILSNAVKYTEKGFVSLGVYAETIDDETLNLVFEVKDSGIGIKPEDMEKLFIDFTQLELERNRGIEGVGLGLAISRSIVNAMGGDIVVESEYGKGSIFTVTLPQKIRSLEPLAKVEHTQGKSVLIFERREVCAESITYSVGNLGVDYILVTSGTELYEIMETGAYDFLFIAFSLYAKNEDTITKFGKDTKVIILAEFGEAIPDKHRNVLSMPTYCTYIADVLNGVYAGLPNADMSAVNFTAPDARVLIVDDINTNLKVAQGLLAPYNMQIDLCNGGAAAIKAMQSVRYDLVFMDHKMPEMDGVEATRLIRKMGDGDPYYNEVPIIALTANAVSGIMDMFMENGFDDYLSKPVDTVKLDAILAKWLPKEKLESQNGKGRQEASKSGENEHFAVEGLDVSRGLAYTGGKIERYIETLLAFYTDATEKLSKITHALESGDLPRYTTHIHGLKSAAAVIGATALRDAAETLETAGKRGDKAYLEANNDSFIIKLRTVLKNVGDALYMIKHESPADAKMVKEDLNALKAALDAMDAGEINRLIEKLRLSTWGADIGTEISKIFDDILIGEFDDAAAAIDSILKEKYA